MGGVKTNDMRAHGTEKTRTEATCSHKTKHKHMASKQITSHVHTRAHSKLHAHMKTGHDGSIRALLQNHK